MLEKDPVMGQQSITEVMRHPWFSDVNWNKVMNKQITPLLIPDIEASYFEREETDGSRTILSFS